MPNPPTSRWGTSIVNRDGTLTVESTSFDSERGGIANLGGGAVTTLVDVAITVWGSEDQTAVYNEGELTFRDSQLSDWDGVGIDNEGTATLVNCLIEGVSSTYGNAVENHDEGVMEIIGCTIRDNRTHEIDSAGAGIHNSAELRIEGSTISGNRAVNRGAGLFNRSSGTVTIVDSVITDNRVEPGDNSEGEGGGIFNAGSLTIESTTITGNAARYGGGIYSAGRPVDLLAGTQLGTVDEPNEAFDGAGILISGATLRVADSIISGNIADRDGGGVYATSAATVELESGGLVTENRASASLSITGFGGGVLLVNSELVTAGAVEDHVFDNAHGDVISRF